MSTVNLKTKLGNFMQFFQSEYTAGLLLFFSVIAAIVWVNSPWEHSYHHLWETQIGLSIGNFNFSQDLHHWINDGLMSIFFFVIGLELKREFISGELSSWKKASLPIFAAVGGMLFPAVIYALINLGNESINGWGIPMATDIAFALGLLVIAGKHIPISVKIFLTALAVVDDLGAVLVIAFFYSSDISFHSLLFAFIFFIILMGGNILGIRNTYFYAIIGITGLWYSFMVSGIHPTIAGVLAAFCIPARTKINEQAFLKSLLNYSKEFEKEVPNNSTLTTERQHQIIHLIKKSSSDAETPLQKLEHSLHSFVAFIVMPIFALANSGISINQDFFIQILNPVSIGIASGLILGKLFGVVIFTKLVVYLKLTTLPANSTWTHIIGVGLLAGVGFTMSLFIAELAFTDPDMIEKSKYGILLASIIAGTTGVLVLKKNSNKKAVPA